ncbi:MAG: DUF5011 domain-containing protein, partial [Acetivibrio sp.]
CPVGTTVTIYDSGNPGPLGKPDPIKVSTATKMGYDPTDIWSKGNPYLDKMVSLTGVNNKTLEYGDKVDEKLGVKALSSTGTDISKNILVSIKHKGKNVKKIDSKTIGKYYVTYSIKDQAGKQAKKQAVFTIKDTALPVLKGVTDIYLNGEDEFSDEIALEEVRAFWHDKKMKKDEIKLELTEEEKTEYLTTYKARYEVKAPNGKKAVKTKHIYIDLEAPTLEGAQDKEITSDTVVDQKFALDGVKISDNMGMVTTKDIKVTITKEEEPRYKIDYWVKDESRNFCILTF